MNGLILALAIVGQVPYDDEVSPAFSAPRGGRQIFSQQCPGGSCDQFGRPVSRGVEETVISAREASGPSQAELSTAWSKYCVRVLAGGAGGSGTVISNLNSQAVVITAQHVTENGGPYAILHRGKRYEATLLAQADTGDLATLEVNGLPSDVQGLGIASKPGRAVFTFGYGPGFPGNFHMHQGTILPTKGIPHKYNAAWKPDNHYQMSGENGDSGAGVFDETGSLCGVFWGGSGDHSSVVATSKIRQFLQAPATDERTFTLSPFFLKCKRVRRGATTVQQPPIEPPSQPPDSGVTVQQGQKGDKGDTGATGATGANGKDVDPAVLTALEARIAAIEANVGRAVTASEKALSNTQRPITFNVVTSKGKIKGAPAQLGSEVNLDVRDPAIETRLATLEARLAAQK